MRAGVDKIPTMHSSAQHFTSGYSHSDSHRTPSLHHSIFSTSQLDNSCMNKIKGVFTSNKTSSDEPTLNPNSFTLLRFADEMKTARRVGEFKQCIVGRSSEATFADAFEKQESIIRYLGGFDSTGEVQKLMGSTPFEVAQSHLAKSGQTSRNAACPAVWFQEEI